MTRPTRLGSVDLLAGPLGTEHGITSVSSNFAAASNGSAFQIAVQALVVEEADDLNLTEGTVTSSTMTDDPNANDGNDSTKAYRAGFVTTGTQEHIADLRTDLGASFQIASCVVHGAAGTADPLWTLEWSNDGTYPGTVAPVTYTWNHAAKVATMTLVTPTTKRYWRIKYTTGVLPPLQFVQELDVWTWQLSGSGVSFGDKTWEPAPAVNDYDDSTYDEAVSGDAVLRADLLEPVEAGVATMLYAAASNGSKSYTLSGTNDPSFATTTLLATTDFTALGSFQPQDVGFSWDPTIPYQYYQVAGPVEARRFHNMEFYAAPEGFASVASNSLALGGVVVGNAAASNYHFVATSSNTGQWQPHTEPPQFYAQNVELSDPYLGTFDVQTWTELFASNLWGAETVGSVTAGGSPVAITNDSSYNAFPGLARLDPDRVILVYRKGSDHVGSDDGRFVGKIGTLAADKRSVLSWGSEFEIYNHASLDVRGENPVAVIDGVVWVSGRHYNNGGTGDNQLPFVLKCNTPAADMTSSSTWTKYDITMSQGSVQNYTQGHLIKLQNGNYLQPVGWDSGGNHTVGVAIVTDPQNWQAPSFVTVGSGANDYSEICVIKEPDGTLTAHLRADSDATHKRATGDLAGTTWSSVANLFDAQGYPMFRRLSSGIRLTIYRSDGGTSDTGWRQDTTGADTAYGSETILDTTGSSNEYAAILQLTPTKVLAVYCIENSSGDADVRSQIFTDSSTFGVQAGADTDELVKVSSNDTTAGYLNGKLVAGTGITLTENNNGSNETLTVAATGSLSAATLQSMGVRGELLITDTPSTPLVFADLIQNEDQNDFLYADLVDV